eukprot:1248917-Amphidinium_carterae.2
MRGEGKARAIIECCRAHNAFPQLYKSSEVPLRGELCQIETLGRAAVPCLTVHENHARHHSTCKGIGNHVYTSQTF